MNTKKEKDEYDLDAELLSGARKGQFRIQVRRHWDSWSPLFRSTADGCGCLTQIKGGVRNAPTVELEEAIKKDSRIPDSPDRINRSHLPVFAEWQRRLDLELGVDRNVREEEEVVW